MDRLVEQQSRRNCLEGSSTRPAGLVCILISLYNGRTYAPFKTLAIANPQHAPYGLAAKQALEHEGLWQDFKKESFSERTFGKRCDSRKLEMPMPR